MNDTNNIKKIISPYIFSNSYILIEASEALIIDPCVSNDFIDFFENKYFSKVFIILTHEHYDHTSGIPFLMNKYDTIIISHQNANCKRFQKIFNRPLVECFALEAQGRTQELLELKKSFKEYFFNSDLTFEGEYRFFWKNHSFVLRHLPGHSPASIMIVLDKKYIFTGDSLIPNTPTTLRWPGSDKKSYYELTLKILHEIDSESIILPGHGDEVQKKYLEYVNNMFMINMKKGQICH